MQKLSLFVEHSFHAEARRMEAWLLSESYHSLLTISPCIDCLLYLRCLSKFCHQQ